MKFLVFLLILGLAGFAYMEKNQVRDLSDKVDQDATDLTAARSAVDDSQRQIAELKAHLGEIDDLKQQNADLKVRLLASQTKVASLTKSIYGRTPAGTQPAVSVGPQTPQSVAPAQPQATPNNKWMWSQYNDPLDQSAQAVSGGVNPRKKH